MIRPRCPFARMGLAGYWASSHRWHCKCGANGLCVDEADAQDYINNHKDRSPNEWDEEPGNADDRR